jgi:hypothetical protein
MTEFLTIEPAPEHASRFAVWCLSRDARVQTVSAGGFLVPLDWYADIPPALLDGAYVDGFLVNVPEPVAPASDRPEPVVTSENDAPSDLPPLPVRKPRRRTSKSLAAIRSDGSE